MYNINPPSLISFFREQSEKNEELIKNKFSEDITRIEQLFDIQHRLAAYYFWTVESGMVGTDDLTRLLITTFHKNLFAFFSAIELTQAGFYGPARPLLRSIFESLIIAKFCVLNHDSDVLTRWINGDNIYLGRIIFPKIGEPERSIFKELWQILSSYTHSNIYSQQILIQGEEIIRDIVLNLSLLQVLLECNYHLLNTYTITKQMIYYTQTYIEYTEEEYVASQLKTTSRSLFKQARRRLGKSGAKFVTTYRRRWELVP